MHMQTVPNGLDVPYEVTIDWY